MTAPRQAAPQDPRAHQKARTRQALVDAAAELFRAGTPPTVAEAADRAKVSRATAYRYFPTQEALRIEAAELAPAMAPVEAMLAALDTDDAGTRVAQLLDVFTPIVAQNEASMRSALRTYMDGWLAAKQRGDPVPVLREGRRMRWLATALAPLRRELSKAQLARLERALALTLSIEALVVMRDVCHVDDDGEALGVLRWAALALIRVAREEAAGGASAAKRSPAQASSRRGPTKP